MGETVKFYPAYWGGKKLAYPNVAAEAPKFANSVVAGNLIFVSGCQGQNDETVSVETDVFEEQMIVALDKVRACHGRSGQLHEQRHQDADAAQETRGLSEDAQDRVGVLPEVRTDAGRGSAGQHVHGGRVWRSRSSWSRSTWWESSRVVSAGQATRPVC